MVHGNIRYPNLNQATTGDHSNSHVWNDASGSRVLFTAGHHEFDPYTETLARAMRGVDYEEEAPPNEDDNDDGDVEGDDPFFVRGTLKYYISLLSLTV